MQAGQASFDFGGQPTRCYAEDAPGAWCYRPGMPSYRDDRPRLFVPASLWDDACCALALSESGDSVASVKSCRVQGRDYVITGVMYHGSKRRGDGWTVVPLDDWQGATFSYRSLIAAMNRESIERGRDTGLVVRINGALCVLDSPVEFVDDNAPSVHDLVDVDGQD